MLRVCAFLLCLNAVAMAQQASDKWIGTWKLNLEKSKLANASAAERVVTFQIVPGGMKYVSDSVNARGTPQHTEYVASFDAKDVVVTESQKVALKRIDGSTFERLIKDSGGNIRTIVRIAVSADGKTLTETITSYSLGPDGKTDIDAGFSINGWLAVLLTFLLAHVFAEGTVMREDVEGTV